MCFTILFRCLNRGNFIELLHWASEIDKVVATMLNDSAKNATYLSSTIQNELIILLAEHIRKQIAEKVSSVWFYTKRFFRSILFLLLSQIKGSFFPLMADETRDVSGHEQLSIVIECLSFTTNLVTTHASLSCIHICE